MTAQPLNPAEFDPKVVNRRSVNVVSRVCHDTKSSIPRAEPSKVPIRLAGKGASAERIADAEVMRRAASAAGTNAPLVLERFASARMAARRGDQRRAIIDIGLVCEAALSRMLNQPAGHKLTLGKLANMAQANGLPVPVDMKGSVVDPRNDAVHRGSIGVRNVQRALEIAEELVSCVVPDHLRVDALVPFNRPQRLDLLLIQPPGGD